MTFCANKDKKVRYKENKETYFIGILYIRWKRGGGPYGVDKGLQWANSYTSFV